MPRELPCLPCPGKQEDGGRARAGGSWGGFSAFKARPPPTAAAALGGSRFTPGPGWLLVVTALVATEPRSSLGDLEANEQTHQGSILV